MNAVIKRCAKRCDCGDELPHTPTANKRRLIFDNDIAMLHENSEMNGERQQLNKIEKAAMILDRSDELPESIFENLNATSDVQPVVITDDNEFDYTGVTIENNMIKCLAKKQYKERYYNGFSSTDAIKAQNVHKKINEERQQINQNLIF